ncbi:YciI family protein [Nonomuraea antimicrobica]|uniref:YciI family protein n=1 Tax=Nonomuraea antimicrobica TaxID=561173 RepID=A0ABP7C861_9ACTN
MKYLLMIYTNPRTWGHPSFLRAAEAETMSQDEHEEMSEQFEALMKEIVESGELVGGEALAAPVHTRTVRVREGTPVTTDGPYVEAKEQLAGFFVVDCESPERAYEIAARFPDARFAAVEVHPIMNLSAQEM